MNKDMLLHVGCEKPTPEIMQARVDWLGATIVNAESIEAAEAMART
jgi:hypothetical protein